MNLCGRGRKKKSRCIDFEATYNIFKPIGVPSKKLEQVEILGDEIESLRLKNLLGFDIISGAQKMGISKSTFARIYDSAVVKITDAIINGKAIVLKIPDNIGNILNNELLFNQNVNMPNNDGTGPNGAGPKTGRGMGKCQNPDNSIDEDNLISSNSNNNMTCCGRQRNGNRGKGNGCGRGNSGFGRQQNQSPK